MNTLSGDNEPYSTLTLDGLNATSTLISSAVGAYLPLSGGTLTTSGTTRLGIASDSTGTLEYTNTAGGSQAAMFYAVANSELRFNVGTNNNVFRVGGSQITMARNVSMGTTNRMINLSPGTGANDAVNYGQVMLRSGVNAATADIPMGGYKLTGLAYGVAGTDAATVAQLTASPYFYLPLAGGTMTGTIVSNTITNPFNFFNSTGPLIGRMSAGQISVTNSCTLQMCSNSSSILDFQDNTNTTKAQFKYTYGNPGTLNMVVNGTTILSATDTEISTKAINVNGQRIYGLNATPSTDTDAVPRLYMANADSVVAANATAALTAEVNSRVASVGAEATTRAAQDALKLSLSGGTMTGDITFSSGNLNMGTGYIQTSSTSNGSLTIADPSSSLTTLTFRNAATLFSSPIGTCHFITEALSQLWIKANVTTHAKESGIQLDAGTFIFFTGDPSTPTQRFSYDASVSNQMNIYGTLNMRTHKISGVVAGAAASTEAVNVTQMEAADLAVTNASVQKLGGTMTGNLTMSGANINMGSGYIGLLAGVNPTDAVNYGQVILRSGVNAMTADLAMGTHKITGVSAGTVSTDAVNYGQTMLLSGANAMTAQLYMGNFRIGNLSPAVTSLDAVNYGQTMLLSGVNAMTGILNMGLNIISNCGPASSATDVVTYTQITNKFVPLTGGAGVGQAMTGQLYMGTNRIGGCGVALSSADCVVYSQIQQSTIPLTAWRSGETIQRKWLAPAFGDSILASLAAGSDAVATTTTMSVTAGNYVHMALSCQLNASGSSNDDFVFEAEFGTQSMLFTNVLPTVSGWRTRTYYLRALFVVGATAVKTCRWRLYNNSTTGDTYTLDNTNWEFSVKEKQA